LLQECICDESFRRNAEPEAGITTPLCMPCRQDYYCDGVTETLCNARIACFPPLYRTGCDASGDYRCETCSVPNNASMIELKRFNNDCEWECNTGYFLYTPPEEPHNPHCKKCSTAACPIGTRRTICHQGARNDSTCQICPPLPKNAILISSTSADSCNYRCVQGFWRPMMETADVCCSDNAHYKDHENECHCLPGWVGDGFQCSL